MKQEHFENWIRIADISRFENEKVTLKGWLYNKRGSGKVQFLQIRDGSGLIQGVVARKGDDDRFFERVRELTQESCVIVHGNVIKDDRAPYCGYELQVDDVVCVGSSINYPISKKEHGDAFLMDHRHLWLRSRRQHAILRIRATLIRAIRNYLDEHGFLLVDSPIFTPSACEGTSTLFQTDWFDGKVAYLTQSGQLYQEATCAAFGKTYCFGPTFRAEKSKTRRHLNEFWMVEPELAFVELEELIEITEDFLSHIVSTVVDQHRDELHSILKRDTSLLEQIDKPFVRLSYDKALEHIREMREACKDENERALLEIDWGMDFGSPHETALTKRFDQPVVVTGFPAQVKAFYMKKDPNNPKAALCMDILAPEGYGEIVGGGQREDSLENLLSEIKRHGLEQKNFEWYLDLRRYGTFPHSGFGLGVERTVAWICGLHHVRETIPFARTLDRLHP